MSSTVENIRAKIKRRFSHKDPEPQNFDEYDSNDEGQDEETSAYLGREIDKAEADGHDQGKPGSLLNRMIAHGNKKTEDQIARESSAQAAGRDTAGVQNA